MNVKIGEARFLLETKTLVVGGQAVALDRNAREILFALCKRPGMDLSKDELLAAGWPDRIVHENSLAKTISRLRKELGPDGDRIVAIYGFGYRLEGAQRIEPEDRRSADHDEQAVPPPGPKPVRGRQTAAITLGAAALIAASALALHAWHGLDPPLRRTPPITAHPSDAVGAVLWVDDHPENNRNEIDFLHRRGIAVDTATTTDDAIKTLAIGRYDLVISDLGRQRDRLAGIKLIAEMKQQALKVPVIIYTIRSPDADQQAAKSKMIMAAGAAGLALSPEEIRAQGAARFAGKIPPKR